MRPSDTIRVVNGAVIVRSREENGASTFWRIERPGAAPRLIARLGDPNRPTARTEFDMDGKFLYTTIADRQSDIYVAELVRRQ